MLFVTPDYDILLSVKEFISLITITVLGEWVKGHYSGKNCQFQHDLNNRADTLATQHLRHQHSPFNTATCPTP
jgi:hypothetical protein